MRTVLSSTIALRPRILRGRDCTYYYDLFPPVSSMPQSVEDDLVRRTKEGDADAENALAKQFGGVAIDMALRYRKRPGYNKVHEDELISAALMGVVEGIKRFEFGRGARVVTCIWFWVRSYLRKALTEHDFVRRPNFQGPETYTTDFCSWEGDQDACSLFQDEAYDPILDEDEWERIVAALDELTPREQEVVNRRFAVDRDIPETLERIGEHLKVTRERVRQIEVEALGKVRRSLARSRA